MKFNIIYIFALVLSSCAFANTENQLPKCPGADVIKAAKLNNAKVFSQNGGWLVTNISRYNTAEEWTFNLFVRAKDKNEAIEKGNKLLEFISLTDGPVLVDTHVHCGYQGEKDGQPIIAFANTSL